MRCLTVMQPWAWQIIHQGKNVENRSRNVVGSYRGPLAIHAGLQSDENALARLPRRAPEWVTASRVFHYGAILGVVDVVGVHRAGECKGTRCDQWGEPDSQHIVLGRPRALLTPIPCKGSLGLWTPPADVLEQLRAVTHG